MSNSKIHIDKLFAEGLESLEIPVFSNDFDNIKKSIIAEPASIISKKAFEDYELAVTDGDWQIIKDRLAREKSKTIVPLPLDYVGASFKDFEIAVTDADWQATKSKLNNTGGKKLVWWWWLNIAIIGTLIGFAVNHFKPSEKLSGATAQTKITESITNNKTSSGIDKTTQNNSNKTEYTPQNKDISVNTIENKVGGNSTSEAKNVNIPANNSKNPESGLVNVTTKVQVNNNSPYSAIASDNSTPVITGSKETIDNSLKNTSKVTEEGTSKKLVDNKKEGNETFPTNPLQTESKETNIQKQGEINPSSALGDGQGTTVNTAVPIDTTNKSRQANSSTSATPSVTLSKLPLNFYIGLTTDIARTFRHLSKDNNPTYNAIRNKADKPLTQISYGITAGIQKGKNQLQSGFLMTEQTFISNYNYTYSKYDSLPYRDQNGVIIGHFLSRKRDTTINTEERLTIKKIDIPFTYNRFWKLDSKTQLITGFGGVLSLNIKTEGTKILNPANNQLYHFSYLKNSEQKFGFSPNINLGIQRTIGKNLVVQSNVFGRYSITNRYDTDFSAKQYPYSKNESSFSAKEYLYSYGLSIKLLYLLN